MTYRKFPHHGHQSPGWDGYKIGVLVALVVVILLALTR